MNEREFSDALGWIVNSPALAIDCETTGLHPHEHDRITGIGVANEYKAKYFPLRHPGENLSYDQARNLMEAVSQKRERILFHNAIFDWAFLRMDGWNYPQPWQTTWDTMVVAWLLDENEPKKLEEQIAIHFSFEGMRAAKEQKERQRRIKKIGWENVSYEDIQAYGTADARHTFDLYRKQQTRLSQDTSLTVARVREQRFLQVCDEMISNGVRVNAERATDALHQCDIDLEILENAYPGLNFDSPKQLAELIYGDDEWAIIPSTYTSGGQPATDKDTLLKFLEYEPRIQDIFDYRKLRKARSTYYEPLTQRLGRDGRVHAWYRPHGTKTGRMSASDPNLQTLPNPETLPGIKECFIPEDGYSLMEYDLEQAELRVAADYASDAVLRAHLGEGDVHSATAMAMFGEPNGSARKRAKNLNFGAIYGIGAKKFMKTSKDLTLTEEQARAHLSQWRTLYAGVTQAMQDAQKIAEDRGFVRLWPEGRYRRFDTHYARFENPKDAFNSVVQGGVGEYVKQLMIELREPALRAGVRIVLNVHDSIVTEVPLGLEKQWTSFVRKTAAAINPFGIDMPVGEKTW